MHLRGRGPSLLPAGVAQAQQAVMGVQSFGNSTTCSQTTLGVASRVSSAMGAGQFITSYLAGSPIGTREGDAGPPPLPAPATGPWTCGLLALGLLVAGARLQRGRDGGILD